MLDAAAPALGDAIIYWGKIINNYNQKLKMLNKKVFLCLRELTCLKGLERRRKVNDLEY